jgi:gluconate 5-dehydrogenase
MTSALFDLAGKTAMVTGSSRGLGFAMAQGLAEAGAAVILNGTNVQRLKDAAADLAAAGHAVSILPFDVTDEAAIEAAFSTLDAQGTIVDILVNNAGIQLRKPMLELSRGEWQGVLDTNLTSAFLVGRAAASRMVARGRGKIINIGSLTSELGRATVTPYAVAKGGIKMLTRQMAAEWASHGIGANAIGPGYIETDLNKALIGNPEFSGWVQKRTPAGRWGRPSELVGTAVFLASAASDFVNGQMIFVDGGITAVL